MCNKALKRANRKSTIAHLTANAAIGQGASPSPIVMVQAPKAEDICRIQFGFWRMHHDTGTTDTTKGGIMMKEYRRFLSGMLAAFMMIGQCAGVLAAENPEAASPDASPNDAGIDCLEAYGFPGGYELDEKDIELKEDMKENGMDAALAGCVEGEDYREGKIWYLADSREDADAVAAAYGAEVTNYSYGVATAELKGNMTVLDAVRAACDTDSPLPPVEPVSILHLEPELEEENCDMDDSLDAAGAVKSRKVTIDPAFKWKEYFYGNYDGNGEYADPIMDNPDPYLMRPDSVEDMGAEYQYQHDMVNTWGAWGSSIGNPDVKVAVIDTGIYAEHEDLCDPNTGTSYVKKAVDIIEDRGFKFLFTHGTHVAGIIAAAVNNGKGGAGIAPGVSLYSYNVITTSKDIFTDDTARAINAAMDDKVHIINMSIGGGDYSSIIKALLKKAYENGISVFAGAGNFRTNEMLFPAGYSEDKSTGVTSVGAVGYDGKRAYYSHYGSWVDVCAPGTEIISTVPKKDENDVYSSDYETDSGTSMATPVVSGVAALYLSAYGTSLGGNKDLAGTKELPKKLKSLILDNGTKVQDLGKLVNAGAMFAAAHKAPSIIVMDSDFNEIEPVTSGKKGYHNAYYVLLAGKSSLSGNRITTSSNRYYAWDKETIIYTIDKAVPEFDTETMEIKYGRKYEGNPIIIGECKPGSRHLIRAMCVTGGGQVSGITSVTVYAPEADDKVGLGTKVTDISLTAMSTKDLKKKPGKSSTIYCPTPYSPLVPSEGGEDRYRFIDLISPELTLANGQKIKDFTKDQIKAMYWVSSNPETVYVMKDENTGKCQVVPVKPGKCKVTLHVYSNGKIQKSKQISVTVKQSIEEMEITSGLTSIEPGASSTYKVTCEPDEADSKKANWFLRTEEKDINLADTINLNGGKAMIDTQTGKLTLDSGVAVTNPPQTFYVVAVSRDTGRVSVQKKVTVAKKSGDSDTLSVNIGSALTPYQSYVERSGNKDHPRVVYSKKGILTQVVIANVDLAGSKGNDNMITLNSGSIPASWSSNNNKVLSLFPSEDGKSVNVYGLKAGKATLHCKASDGSKKSASLTVYVKTPISGIGLAINDLGMVKPVAVGTSVVPGAKVGKTYGNPSRTELKWSYTVGRVEVTENDKIIIYGPEDESLKAEIQNAVTFSEKSGKITIKKAKWNSSNNDKVYIRVKAEATDGTGYSDYATYVVTTPVSQIKLYVAESGKYREIKKDETIRLDPNGYLRFCLVEDGMGSNNQNIMFGSVDAASTFTGNGGVRILERCRYQPDLGRYAFECMFLPGKKKGKTGVYFKALDGSKKSLRVSVETTADAK